MAITPQQVKDINALCAQMRRELIETLHKRQTGHPGGSLSCCEILATLYQYTMNVDPADPQMPNRDRLVLSKGHAAPMLYLNLAHKGFLKLDEFGTLRMINSRLQGHPCAHKTPGVELSTGPLGLGLSAGNGMAVSSQINHIDYNVFVVLGDGELQEGGIWEAAMTACKYKLPNMVAILDYNQVQLDGTNQEILPLGDVTAKFEAFGWKVLHTNGHDVQQLADTLDEAVAYYEGPVIIVADTVKGKGVSFMEGKSTWHGKPINDDEYAQAMKELGGGAHE